MFSSYLNLHLVWGFLASHIWPLATYSNYNPCICWHLRGLWESKLKLCQVGVLVHDFHSLLRIGVEEGSFLSGNRLELLDLHHNDVCPCNRLQVLNHQGPVERQITHVQPVVSDARQWRHASGDATDATLDQMLETSPNFNRVGRGHYILVTSHYILVTSPSHSIKSSSSLVKSQYSSNNHDKPKFDYW